MRAPGSPWPCAGCTNSLDAHGTGYIPSRKRAIQPGESWKLKIQTTIIVNRLNAFVLGKNDPITKEPFTMTAQQVKAAEALLKKVAPDLQSVAHTGEDGGPLVVQIVRYADNPDPA